MIPKLWHRDPLKKVKLYWYEQYQWWLWLLNLRKEKPNGNKTESEGN